MVEPMHFLGVGEAARLLVEDQRVVFPRVPVTEHDFHEFVGAVIAGIVPHMLAKPEIPGLRAVQRGHDIPGDPALQHQIHRREDPRDMKRLVIGRRIGHAQPEPRRRHPHRHQHGRGIELDGAHAGADRRGVMAGIEIGQRQPVVEKRHLDLAVLQRPRDPLVVFRRQEIEHRRRMAPGAGQVRAVLRLQERDQLHHAVVAKPSGGLVRLVGRLCRRGGEVEGGGHQFLRIGMLGGVHDPVGRAGLRRSCRPSSPGSRAPSPAPL